MKKKSRNVIFFLFLCLFSVFHCHAISATHELENLENLISVTEQNLKELAELKSSILAYQELQNLFLDHPNNKDLLIKTGRAAKIVLETIKEMHVTHLFDAKFLSELSLFSKMVKKPSLQKN